MAVENRGGMRPTAPQNNPANVNAMGGNGQSGNVDYTGFGYGMNKAINEQRQAFPISKTPSMPSAPSAAPTGGAPMVGITDPTMYPDNPIGGPFTGNPQMMGMMPSVLPEPGQMLYDTPDKQLIRSYMPALEFWASRPGTPQDTIDYVRYLRTVIPS